MAAPKVYIVLSGGSTRVIEWTGTSKFKLAQWLAIQSTMSKLDGYEVVIGNNNTENLVDWLSATEWLSGPN